MEITLPDITESLNKILNEAKAHWSKYHRMQKTIVSGLILYLRGQEVEPVVEYPVRITFHYFVKNKRMDPDNICAVRKFILDALVKSGIMEGDSWRYIAPPFKDYWEVDDNPRIVVTIKEATCFILPPYL